MTVAVVDSTVIIHLLRSYPPAMEWANALTERLDVPSITWLEVMFGAPSKAGQARANVILSRFTTIFLTPEDQAWAMEQMEQHRLSQGVGIHNCLIASVTYRLQVPVYTDNQKDFLKILPPALVVKPY